MNDRQSTKFSQVKARIKKVVGKVYRLIIKWGIKVYKQQSLTTLMVENSFELQQ